MNDSKLCRRLLEALWRRGQQNEIVDIFTLADDVAVGPGEVLVALAALGRAGLVDARRVRLTLEGLAVATALIARRTGAAIGPDGARERRSSLAMAAPPRHAA